LSFFIVILLILSLFFAHGVFTRTGDNENDGETYLRENKPPIAILSVSSTYLLVGESVTLFGGESYDIDGWISGYIFSFGDGSESGLISERSIVHFYEEPGNYSVKLMVVDDRNQKSFWSDSILISVAEPEDNPPVARLFVKERVRTHENVLFDASESYDPEGKILSYVYDFGDGNNTGSTYNNSVYHSYEESGEYNVSLYVIDEKGLASIPVYKVINVTDMPPPQPQAPIAVLKLSATSISVNGTIEFDASNSFDPDGYIVKYFFRVAQDLEISTTDSKICYKYTKPGRYYSLLRVEDNDGLQSDWTKEIEINVRTDGIDLGEKFVLLVEEPRNESEQIFVTSLSTIAVHNGYHPFFILDDGDLDKQQLATLEGMNVSDDWTFYLFSMNTTSISKVMEHGFNVKVLPATISTLEKINGFSGNITVSSFEESLWAAPIAALEGKIVLEGKKTYHSQEEAWEYLHENGVNANYIVVANPNDNSTFEEEKYHIPSLSLVAGELAAYHRAYVLTNAPASTEQIAPASLLDTTLNARAIGIYSKIKYINTTYGPSKYLALVGSAVAVPQFLFNFEGEGDGHVSSDSAYGFIDSNMSTMDISVGRIINYNVQGASNMLARTFGYSLFEPNTTVHFTRTGDQVVNWKTHGAAISGMQITYQRHQATPCLFLCEDYIDEGYNYTYMGPSSMTLGRETIVPSLEPDAKPIFQSSAFVGYRGHGTSDSSAIGIGVYGSPYGTLYGRDFRNFTIPPQVGMFAACENGKIYGLDYGGLSVDTREMFVPNYLYSGAVAMVGSTEVSYSYPHQDFFAISGRDTGNHYWEKNNAYFAFFWDGILDHEMRYGSVGDALKWAHNRYIATHDYAINPFNLSDTLYLTDWKQVAEYVLYGDPAFVPWQPKMGNNSVDEWHNGYNEGLDKEDLNNKDLNDKDIESKGISGNVLNDGFSETRDNEILKDRLDDRMDVGNKVELDIVRIGVVKFDIVEIDVKDSVVEGIQLEMRLWLRTQKVESMTQKLN